MSETTITINASHGLPIVADRMPERTVEALLDGAEQLGTTHGVGYLRVGVVLAREEASGTILGIYATERQWGETTAAALIEREMDNERLRAALVAQEARNAEQAAELERLRWQVAAQPPTVSLAQPASSPAPTAKVRAPIPCPDPACGETRTTVQALWRHCQAAHGATLNELRARHTAAPVQVPAPDQPSALAAHPDPAQVEDQEQCPVPECGVTLPPKRLAHHAIDDHGELLTVLRRRHQGAAEGQPPQDGT